MPTVLISGGSGLIGTNLTRHLLGRNYEVIILSRDGKKSADKPKISYAHWDIEKGEMDGWPMEKADHIIHLAGAGVMEKRWTDSYKKEILESRTKSSALLINTLLKTRHRLQSFISASAIGWYGENEAPLVRTEGFIETDKPADSFLGETCRLWEESVDPVVKTGARLVKLRTGIVLSNDGGAYKEFKMPFKFGVAGILGSGKQIVIWIHIDDLCRIYIESIVNGEMEGVYNAVAPQPVTNKELVLAAAEVVKGDFFIPIHVPSFVLRLLLGKQSTEVLKSATVSSRKIKSGGFSFLYPSIKAATRQLAGK